MITLYSDNLQALAIIAKGLNEIDEQLEAAGESHVQMGHVTILFDQERMGTMVDEIGGSWAWTERETDRG